MTRCTLCDLPTPEPPVTAPDADGAFCCRGCLEVYRAVGEANGESPEELLATEDAADAPVPADAATIHLAVTGMHCTTCEAFLEKTAGDHDAVYAADASYTTDVLELQYDDEAATVDELASAVSGLGYRASPVGEDETRARADDAREFARMRVFLAAFLGMITMGLYAVFLYPAYLGLDWSGLLSTPGAALSLFGPVVGATTLELVVVGYPVLRGAYVAVRARQLNMDVLVALGALVPYLYSLVVYFALGGTVVYFDVTTTVVTVVTVGNYVKDVVKRRAVEGVTTGTATRVTEARRVTADGTERVPVASCRPGDRLRVEAGERVPVDGVVGEGTATVDESLLTGEAHPRSRGPDDEVVGGSTVLDGALTVTVGEATESTLDRIVGTMRHVQSTRAGVKRLADRLAAVFVPLVVLLAVLTTLAWAVTGAPLRSAVLTGVAVLVVSCPCSLGLATPIALVSGVRAAAERDVAVLNADALEGLADADVVAFDKTGTLTTGEMRVDAISTGGGEDAGELVARAAAVEATADHPVADAVTLYAEATASAGHAPEPSPATSSRPEGRNRGVSAVVDDVRVTVGHPSLFEAVAWPSTCRDALDRAEETGALPVVVGWAGRVRRVLLVDDAPRAGWEATLSHLHDAGHRVVVLTGDDEARVGRYEAADAVDDVFAEVPPEAKAEVLRRLGAEGTTVMVGDGTNDAPALAAADLGVAFASGTDVALEAADATVLSDDLDAIEDAFRVGAVTHRRVRENLAWAFGYNAVALPLAALGLVNPLVASVAMAASSVLVVANSARGYGVDDHGAREGTAGQPAPDVAPTAD